MLVTLCHRQATVRGAARPSGRGMMRMAGEWVTGAFSTMICRYVTLAEGGDGKSNPIPGVSSCTVNTAPARWPAISGIVHCCCS